MRFTEFENHRALRFEGNFSKLLVALEQLHSDDAQLRSALRELDWEEPLHIVTRFKLDNREEAVVELAHPMSVLIRLQNRRLLDAALVEDMLPEEETHYNESNLMRWTYGREGMWAKALSEAFACADWRSAEKIKEWCGPRVGDKFELANLSQGPLGRLCAVSRSASPEDRLKAVELGLLLGSESAQAKQWGVARVETPEEIAQHTQDSLNELLNLAASEGNQTLCDTLIGKGAQRSWRLLRSAVNKGLFDLFWDSLELMRASPDKIATSPLREQREPAAPSPLLSMLAESMARGAQSAFESVDRRRHENYEMECFLKHKDRALAFLIHAFSDGLALPGSDPKAIAEDQQKALAAITPALAQLESPELIAMVDRMFPSPDPFELRALLDSRQIERFKSRALIAKASGNQWSAQSAAELSAQMIKWLSGAAKSGAASKSGGDERSEEALNLLAWVEVSAREILPEHQGSSFILSSSSVSSARYSLLLEKAVLESVAPPVARKGPGPRKA